MDLDLKGRAYVVTGGSRGLGRATAEALVADGADVVVVARGEAGVMEAAAELTSSGPGRAVGIVSDLADPQAAPRVVAAAKDSFGRIDGALLSVGGPPAGPALDAGDDVWRAAFESVFLGALRLVRALVGDMTTGGSIALVLSSSVRSPIGGLAISNGLRPGLAMLAKTIADEVGPSGIRLNGLMPGRLATARVAELDAAGGDADASRKRWEAQIPLRRYGEPIEFGRVAAFLLSPASSYVTGAMLPVDGGLVRAL